MRAELWTERHGLVIRAGFMREEPKPGRSIVNVRDVSEQTATASNETAKSSVELARLGSQLQQMVSHFRV